MEKVILVDEQDLEIGSAEKLEAHLKGLLHRAFSVFIFNDKQELLLQQRAWDKYHSPGLWSNTCCSHPKPGEETLAAAQRRCEEEMGIRVALHPVFAFTYRVTFENQLIEHEYDHVFFGQYNATPQINPEEVANYKWASMDQLRKDLQTNPSSYTEWFKICYEQVSEHFEKHKD